MSRRRFYLDTSFVVGLLNPRDEMHVAARRLYAEVRSAAKVWLTEAVLVEIGNGLASVDRGRAGMFLEQCYGGAISAWSAWIPTGCGKPCDFTGVGATRGGA